MRVPVSIHSLTRRAAAREGGEPARAGFSAARAGGKVASGGVQRAALSAVIAAAVLALWPWACGSARVLPNKRVLASATPVFWE